MSLFQKKKQKSLATDLLLGVAVGDALGVPVEFENRSTLMQNPIMDMVGYGTYGQPAGTWSDDSSLTLCLAESLTKGFDLRDIGNTFRRWLYENHWTARGDIFDIGGTTRNAIERLGQPGLSPELAGGMDELDNGNGSLMRILPMVLYVKDKPIAERYRLVKLVSSLTHAHFRSCMSCFVYIEYALELMLGKKPKPAQSGMIVKVRDFFSQHDFNPEELARFNRVLDTQFYRADMESIRSSGYVIHSLEAAIWCLQTTSSYAEAVLKAVNLGTDTDTTAAIAGGLAGIHYGHQSIPKQWLKILARTEDIKALARQLDSVYPQSV